MINYGEKIRELVMDNLLQALSSSASKGSVKDIIVLSKFILKLSHQFDKVNLELFRKKEIK